MSDPRAGPDADHATAATARRRLAARFRAAGLDEAALDARRLVEGVAGPERAFDAVLTAEQAARLDGFAARRLAGEPVGRILGEREFWGLPFRLSPATLEPRPDSETLVELALAALEARRREPLALLDLGTGTGCLLLALLSELPQAHGTGIDIEPDAVATARVNAQATGLEGRAVFRAGDWTQGLAGQFDLVVSNPPYIEQDEIARLATEVRAHDPLRALDGGPDGLDAYRCLAQAIPAVLRPGGLVVLEIGAGQEEAVTALMAADGLRHRETRRDLGGHARALLFSRDD